MAVFGDLPPEVLEKIFLALERQSLMTASNVCLKWRKVIHDFTSLSAYKCDSNLQTELEKCGWIFGDHDLENCKCIELNTSMFKFIGNVTLSCNEVNENYEMGNNLFLVESQKQLFINCGGRILANNLNPEELGLNLLFDRSNRTRTEFMRGKCVEVEEEVIFAPINDQTIVTVIREISEEKDDEKGYYQLEYFSQDKLVVWNLETLLSIDELNYHDIVNGFTDDQFDKGRVQKK